MNKRITKEEVIETETKKTITLTMSERRPIKICPEEWPIVAEAEAHDGKVACQANTEWYIRVREGINGRRIVYGVKQAGKGGQYAGFRGARVGYLVENVREDRMREDRNGEMTACWPDDDETIRAIRRVAGMIDREDLGAECIGDLPAETL